jgi:hypothetical protein
LKAVALLAGLRYLQCNSHVLRNIFQDRLELALRPKSGRLVATHAGGLSRQTHALRGLF